MGKGGGGRFKFALFYLYFATFHYNLAALPVTRMYAQKYVIKTTLIFFEILIRIYINCRGGVFEDVLSVLKSLALVSKPTSLRKCPVLGSRIPLFFDWLKKENNQAKDNITASLSMRGFSSAFEK